MKKDAECDSKYFELNKRQILELIKLADFKKNDIFYDLGSGTGKVLIEVAKHSHIQKSIGIESMKKLYEKARMQLVREHSARKIKNLKRVDFWLGHLDNEDEDNDGNLILDYSNATVIFASLDEHEGDVSYYKKRSCWNKTRIIKKDIPLVGYRSVANRSNADCWLFLSKPPHKRINKKDWIRSISADFQTLDEVYNYYLKQLVSRFTKLYLQDGKSTTYSKRMAKKDAVSSLLQLKMVINERF